MVVASQLVAGMTILMNQQPYRVERVVKVASPKAGAFIKVTLCHLATNEIEEKNCKADQSIEEIALTEDALEYLYQEGKEHIFLNRGSLELVHVAKDVVGKHISYLKEGIEVKGICFGPMVLTVELPQFLELMVSSIEGDDLDRHDGSIRVAVVETGAKLEVPSFIDVGDVIKVDTRLEEYVQRV